MGSHWSLLTCISNEHMPTQRNHGIKGRKPCLLLTYQAERPLSRLENNFYPVGLIIRFVKPSYFGSCVEFRPQPRLFAVGIINMSTSYHGQATHWRYFPRPEAYWRSDYQVSQRASSFASVDDAWPCNRGLLGSIADSYWVYMTMAILLLSALCRQRT